MSDEADITVLLERWQTGDDVAGQELWEQAYSTLKTLAQPVAAREASESLQATHLVHAAWEKLERGVDQTITDTRHFELLVVRAMRQVIVDHARRRAAAKRGGGATKHTLDQVIEALEQSSRDVIDVHNALEELARNDEQLSQVIELQFFGGLNGKEIATLLDVSPKTVNRRLVAAKGWLFRLLGGNRET